jgi:hypothetical protein
MGEVTSRANGLEFQNQLNELIATGVDLSSHPHVKACELCSALLHDIYRIAERAKRGPLRHRRGMMDSDVHRKPAPDPDAYRDVGERSLILIRMILG